MSFIFFFIIFILALGLVIVFSIFGIIRNVLGAIFGFGRRRAAYQTGSGQSSYENTYHKQKTKVFEKNEGEYIDFEELKD
jgi:hypothetical protein